MPRSPHSRGGRIIGSITPARPVSLADEIARGQRNVLGARNTTLALVSRVPYARIAAFKKRMGWALPWYSSWSNSFNFDFDVIGMDPARVGTVLGEISFCAHNSAGWRQVLDHAHETVSLADWHKAHGRHRIYANGTVVPLQLVAAERDSAHAPGTEANM